MKKIALFLWCFVLIACTSVSSEAQTQTVYITRTGAKYHEAYCRYLRQSKIPIELKDALARGYDACSVCDPPTEVEEEEEQQPRAGNAGTPPKQDKSLPAATQGGVKRTTTASASQCTASTKSGSRCKRTTTNANGRCYQHQ